MAATQTSEWTTVIKPKASLLEVDFKELWQYHDLYRMFVKRDIVTWYKQTILGPLWFFIQPIMTTIMFMVVFGGIAKISTDGLPQPLFYLAGICLWTYFSECLNQTSKTFIENANMFGKVYFLLPYLYQRSRTPQHLSVAYARTHPPYCSPRARLRRTVQQPHHQIPRPHIFAHVYRTALDVCNPGDLPAQHHRRSAPKNAHAGKPSHQHHGNI